MVRSPHCANPIKNLRSGVKAWTGCKTEGAQRWIRRGEKEPLQQRYSGERRTGLVFYRQPAGRKIENAVPLRAGRMLERTEMEPSYF